MAAESWLPTLWGEGKDRRDPFRGLRKQMDELFEDWAMGPPRFGLSAIKESFSPSIDVSESDKEITITAELPGVEQKDLGITLTGNLLTIKGEKKTESEEKKEEKGRTYHRIERSYGSFQRSMTVPFEADPAKVDAKFRDGVLTVTLPKPPEVQKQTRKIEVKKGA